MMYIVSFIYCDALDRYSSFGKSPHARYVLINYSYFYIFSGDNRAFTKANPSKGSSLGIFGAAFKQLVDPPGQRGGGGPPSPAGSPGARTEASR